MRQTVTTLILGIAVMLLMRGELQAARIQDVVETNWTEQAGRFLSLKDPSVRYALLGSMLLGISCGCMGSFLVVRKLSLMGDALSHAVLPGVALGFMWNMTKDAGAIFIGATFAALLGAGVVQWIRSTTKHKEDAALGFVLASFYGVGICLFTMIQNKPEGAMSGLDKFMFGQAAALGSQDLYLLAGVTFLIVGVVTLFYKEYRLTSFDPSFARTLGIPVPLFHYSFMLLLAFAIVASLQAVGVVLVTALLVIPAATAFLLTDRLSTLLVLSAVLGMVAGGLGAFFSFVGRNLPTGPFMVISAGAIFSLALAFGPRYGILTRWWRERSRSSRIRQENLLKSIYHIMEDERFENEIVSMLALAQRRKESLEEVETVVNESRKSEWLSYEGDAISFTPSGWQRACEIVRNHRLWELYLTNEAQLAPDHVHADAEMIEHVLGEETVRMLEKRLNYARRDPHGKLIPGLDDIREGRHRLTGHRAVGFGGGES